MGALSDTDRADKQECCPIARLQCALFAVIAGGIPAKARLNNFCFGNAVVDK